MSQQQHQPDDPVLTPQEQALFEQHQSIIRMAVVGKGFRSMPLGGEAALTAGLVVQSDPGWSMSDAPGASDGFRLTDLGTKLALAQGWRCQCAGCNEWRNRKGWSPAVTSGRFCSNCRAGIAQFGTVLLHGQESCKFDARRMLEADQKGE